MLQTDDYSANKALAKGGAVELAFCWTHTRRYFHKALDEKSPAKTPIAAEAIAGSSSGRPSKNRSVFTRARWRLLLEHRS